MSSTPFLQSYLRLAISVAILFLLSCFIFYIYYIFIYNIIILYIIYIFIYISLLIFIIYFLSIYHLLYIYFLFPSVSFLLYFPVFPTDRRLYTRIKKWTVRHFNVFTVWLLRLLAQKPYLPPPPRNLLKADWKAVIFLL